MERSLKIWAALPLNISRAMDGMLREFAEGLSERHGRTIEVISQSHCQSDSAEAENVCGEEKVPDMVIANPDYFSAYASGNDLDNPLEELQQYFQPVGGRFQLREELAGLGFEDPDGILSTFTVMPLSVFCNPSHVGQAEMPNSWDGLLTKDWAGQISIPDSHHMAPKTLLAFLHLHYPECSEAIAQNFVCNGTPLNVVNAVYDGMARIGVTNISFAKISSNRNMKILQMKEGDYCVPLTMAFKKGADPCLLEVGDYLMSEKIQNFLAMQSFLPASKTVAMPAPFQDEALSIRWNGWGECLKALNMQNALR